ncbi:M23 family metallopeptidase [Actinomadura rudentiformis]|uniref:M23 family metallopeptidase n=1 Tax=Actinomadura rudentiformis TaxID=359158 RepID=UPI001CEF9A2B|nr:M23 family metallopeptidase [Actinomadura rudentiformis]
MNTGAIVFSIVTGLALLAVVERSVIEGGPIGQSGPAGAERPLDRPSAKAALPNRNPQQPAPPQQNGGGGGGGGGGAAAVPDLQVLTSQVRDLTAAQRGAAALQEYGVAADKPPVVVVSRVSRDRTWAFGTAAVPVPAGKSSMPHVALFAARWTAGRWQPVLSGTPAFAGLVGRMPPAMMSVSEARLLSRHSATTAGQAAAATNGTRVGDGLMLPWRVGGVWSLSTGDAAGARPLATLAFQGGDGRVAAAGDGRLYRFCAEGNRGFVMVIHPSGLASAYYRMRDVVQLRDGSVVKQGDPLGRTGGDLPCGGAPAPREQVQFGLRGASENVPLDGAQIGGWIFRERARPLLGFAERGLLQVLPGGLLANFGPVPPTEPPGAAEQPAPGARPGTPPAGGTQQKGSKSAGQEQ